MKGAAKAIRAIGVALTALLIFVIMVELYFMYTDFASQNIMLEPLMGEITCSFNGSIGILKIPIKVLYNGSHMLKSLKVISLINTTKTSLKFQSKEVTLEAKSSKIVELQMGIPVTLVQNILRKNATMYFGLSFMYDGIFGVEILTKSPQPLAPKAQLYSSTLEYESPEYRKAILGFIVVNPLPVPIEGSVCFIAQGAKSKYNVTEKVVLEKCFITPVTIEFTVLNEDLEKGIPYVLLLKVQPDIEIVLNKGLLKV